MLMARGINEKIRANSLKTEEYAKYIMTNDIRFCIKVKYLQI